MKNLRKKFELFCFKNRNKGIPNLMLYIVIGTAVVYLFSQMSGSMLLYSALCFNREAILQGQVWRLITYPLTYSAGNILLTAITLLCYYSLGRAMENVWGTLRFNLFYLTGVVMMDIYCMIFALGCFGFLRNRRLALARQDTGITFSTSLPKKRK